MASQAQGWAGSSALAFNASLMYTVCYKQRGVGPDAFQHLALLEPLLARTQSEAYDCIGPGS